jgi:colanic acid/amylovoran biosynthesis glycosyltransferase
MIHYMTSEGLGSPWVGNELRIVTQAGVPVRLHCMRAPAKIHFDSAWAKELQASAGVLYPLSTGELLGAALMSPFVFGGRWFAALLNALVGERENMRARVACLAHFFVACMWAMRVRRSREAISHIHAQWAFSSASIAMYGAWLLGVPFSFTGHAVDLTRQRVALRDKIRRAKFIIAISEWHKRFYLAVDRGEAPWERTHALYKGGAESWDLSRGDAGLARKIHVAYCGIYTDEMKPASDAQRAARVGQPFTILSAGRLIGKKGFAYVIEACKLLKERGAHTRGGGVVCILAGSGPDEQALRDQIASMGVGDIVTMTGKALQQEKIPAFMHGGDVFVLPCVWAADGDVDGLPQLTMEAMGCGIAAITTRLVGNPDLVVHEKTGLLVAPNDASGLADAIERLMNDAALRERWAGAGRAFVLERFDIRRSLDVLIEQYRGALGQASGAQSVPGQATTEAA